MKDDVALFRGELRRQRLDPVIAEPGNVVSGLRGGHAQSLRRIRDESYARRPPQSVYSNEDMTRGLWGATLLTCVLAATGCFNEDIRHCPTVDCPADEVCDGVGGCAVQAQL